MRPTAHLWVMRLELTYAFVFMLAAHAYYQPPVE